MIWAANCRLLMSIGAATQGCSCQSSILALPFAGSTRHWMDDSESHQIVVTWEWAFAKHTMALAEKFAVPQAYTCAEEIPA